MDLLEVLGLSKPVADCALCLELYFDDLQGDHSVSGVHAHAVRDVKLFDVARWCCPAALKLTASAHVKLLAGWHAGAGSVETQQLHALKLRCEQLLQPLVASYIWQHEPLRLQSSLQQQPLWVVKASGKELRVNRLMRHRLSHFQGLQRQQQLLQGAGNQKP